MTFEKRTSLLALFAGLCTLVLAYPQYQLQIPNGEGVLHPCNEGQKWRGVGHINPLGGGARNPFGEAFAKSNFKWTELLCMADSDGDDVTNGQELGDPDCTWTPGSVPAGPARSHPGICEPMGDKNCTQKNIFVACEGRTFECDALKVPETFSREIKVPTELPGGASSITCMDFEFYYDQEHHLVGSSSSLHKQEVVQSINVYACANGHSRPLWEPYSCETENMACENVIALWRRGMNGECHDPMVGIPVGGDKDSGYRYATIQIRRSNPSKNDTVMDESGIIMYLTPKLRPNKAGYFYFGPRYIEIPPNQQHHMVEGRLGEQCLRSVLQNPITVLKVMGEMHLAGVTQQTTLIRNSQTVNYLAVDESYNIEHIRAYRFPMGVEVKPGDELLTECSYYTIRRTSATFWGEGYLDEQCFAYVMYYPRENLPKPHFKRFRSISSCERKLGTAQGCDLNLWKNPNHIEGVTIKNTVKEKCQMDACLPACLEYVRGVKKTACFHGDADRLLRTAINITQEARLEQRNHYVALDSCDEQLALETYDDSGTSVVVLHVALLHVVLVLQELIVIHFTD